VIIDAGPLVTFCDRRDRRHGWVVEVFRHIAGPLLTCESVMAEALYLTRHRADMQDALLAMIGEGLLSLPFNLERDVENIRSLRLQYQNVPMSLADACLVRLAEEFDGHQVCTFDSDFIVYRKHGKTPISLITPD
jgi:predicted nucleic acid-binding protein